jgi:hypothetical protein
MRMMRSSPRPATFFQMLGRLVVGVVDGDKEAAAVDAEVAGQSSQAKGIAWSLK